MTPSEFSIGVKWLDPTVGHAPDPTAARLRIAVGGQVATWAENRWSQSVVEAVPLSAAPLATWFAVNWWRLRHEPEWPERCPPLGWRMAHEVAAVGEGFVWPRLRIVCDGASVEFENLPSDPRSHEMLFYMSDFLTRCSVQGFEGDVDRFIALVLERLGQASADFDLAALWRIVLAERADPVRTAMRRMEAMLGYEPDEAPAELLDEVAALGATAGDAGEIAAICASVKPSELRAAVARAELRASPAFPLSPHGTGHVSSLPPLRGNQLAQWMRSQTGLDERNAVTNDDLAGLLGMRADALIGGEPDAAPASLMIRAQGGARVVLRRRHAHGRRFDAARLIGDALGAPGQGWQIAAETRTARQKLQRAFAAEFLAPIEGIRIHLGQDQSEEAITDTAEHFAVSEMTVRHQLENYGSLDRGGW